jgi:hypothetical protein
MPRVNPHKLLVLVAVALVLSVVAAAASAPAGARAMSCESTPGFSVNPVQGLVVVTCPYEIVQVCLDAASQFSGWSQVSGSCYTSATGSTTSGSHPFYAYSNRVSCISGVVYRPKWGSGTIWTYGSSQSFC